jgi:hypothetical protein
MTSRSALPDIRIVSQSVRPDTKRSNVGTCTLHGHPCARRYASLITRDSSPRNGHSLGLRALRVESQRALEPGASSRMRASDAIGLGDELSALRVVTWAGPRSLRSRLNTLWNGPRCPGRVPWRRLFASPCETYGQATISRARINSDRRHARLGHSLARMPRISRVSTTITSAS